MELIKALNHIQKTLKAPKGQFNKFGNYKYRSCEDILEAVKPIIPDGFVITITDEIVHIGDRFYVKATATLTCVEKEFVSTDAYARKEFVSTDAYAREAENKKGMDASQITGAASSYARKYALNGLLLIDDTKDADTRDNREKPKETQTSAPEEAKTATQKQRNAIRKMAVSKFGLVEDQLTDMTMFVYGCKVDELTTVQASKIISDFDGIHSQWTQALTKGKEDQGNSLDT